MTALKAWSIKRIVNANYFVYSILYSSTLQYVAILCDIYYVCDIIDM